MRAIDIRELLGRPGAASTERIDEPLEDLHTELADVPPDAPIEGDLVLENVVEGVLVSGTLHATMTMRCARCLNDFSSPIDVEVSELFRPEPDPDGDDYAIAPEGVLDPEPMVRDALGRCGGDRNLGECACAEEIDARWAPLRGFSEN